ncbi:c-type cytochrome [Bradyrhizobium sp.]|uniref:c-type cytochrome n=1 Tax=Bradyrhizobium sp. TaxID=376 RepID=UPI003C5DC199
MRRRRAQQGRAQPCRGARRAILLALLSLLPHLALAQNVVPESATPNGRTFSSGYSFVEMSGQELFANVCQGCHMEDAAGASGAGSYPSLVADKNLEASEYPVDLVLNGRRAMPSFASMMSDGQVAAVVNYLRTHFGNSYPDPVTARDVRNIRR